MKPLFVLSFAAAFLAAAMAAETKAPFSDLADDSDKPIKIYCDGGQEFDFNTKTTICHQARIEQGEMVLRANEVQAEAAGESSKVKSITATGDVIITSRDATARAPHAVYETEARTIHLSGGVILTQGGNTLRGTDLVVDLKAGKAKLTAAGGRVEGILQPGEIKNQ